MNITLVVALIGLAGVLASAVVQYYLGRQAEVNKKIVEIRAQAYLDLLNSASEIAASAKYDEGRKLEQFQKLSQAKTRVVLIGSNEVVKAVNDFWMDYGVLNSNEAVFAFSSIVSAMRKDLSGQTSLPDKLLSQALFGKEAK